MLRLDEVNNNARAAGLEPGQVVRIITTERIGDTARLVEYEPDTSLRDTEQITLLEEGGIKAFIEREVLPYVPDAWVDESKTAIGYEISFTRHFYKPQPLRTLDEIKADILDLEEIIGEA